MMVKMANGYEMASKSVIPAARLRLARELKGRYNLTESRIASILGVAQAAVSKYLNGEYSKSVDNLANQIDASSINGYIKEIAEGSKVELKKCVCSICASVNKFDCKFSQYASQ